MHGVLNIVLALEPNLLSEQSIPNSEKASENGVAPPAPHITPAQRKSIVEGEHKDSLARQVLLACLRPAELTKVYQLQSAHEIWTRLGDEYGVVSDVRRAQAESAFHLLHRKPETPLQTHIDEFTKLQQEVDYHRGDIPPLSNIQINLTFLRSLGDDWRSFQQSMAPHIHTIKPATLFAEVLQLLQKERS